ncbi:MAG: hypothetical protein HY075_00255 [Deltaproteobacteria bacterium]|nr:hypothetical protein [Deltaproteobacteria bacterium]
MTPLWATPPAPVYDVAKTTAHFTSLGFSCSAFEEGKGLFCKGKLDASAYPEPIVLIVPPGYRVHHNAPVVLYLHGHLSEGETFDSTLEKYRFDQMYAKTKRQAILVIPSSLGKCDTFKSQLRTDAGFRALLDAVYKALADSGLSAAREPGSILLTGHSGSYSTIESILTNACAPKATCYRSHIRTIVLFESIYGDGDGFVPFAKASPPNRFYSVFLPLKKSKHGPWKWTAAGNFSLWSQLNPSADPESFLDSCLPPGASAKTVLEAMAKGPVFMRSDVDHEDTVKKYFPRLLTWLE